MTAQAQKIEESTQMVEIEALTEQRAAARDALRELVANIQKQMDEIKDAHIDELREAYAKATGTTVALVHGIEAAPHLFEKPKSQVFHNTKVGYRQSAGVLSFDDAEQVCKAIQKHLPDDYDVLVKETRAPIKEGLKNLPVGLLKKLGVRFVQPPPAVVIKDTDTDLDKLLKGLFNPADYQT